MSEVWQCAVDSYREIRGESGVAVLGLLGVSKVQDHAEYLKWGRCMEMVIYPLYPSLKVNFEVRRKTQSLI